VGHIVFLGLGANLGDRLANLRHGLRRLEPEIHVRAVSPLYESEPVGVTDQPLFYNAACVVETELSPDEVLDRAKAIERAAGRRPGPIWGPRPLDIDLLLYDDATLVTERLQVPHARLAEREFVLRPLADLAPEQLVPGTGASVQELLGRVGDGGVRRIAAGGWERGDTITEMGL
jgi:2-amino-4-hydroxy-6-hydroxymethyldihydropteridine diphosphokinase